MLTFNNIKEKNSLSSGEAIISHLKETKYELDSLTKNIDYVTDPILLNQLIFQLKAAEVRYQYWFCMAKEQNICGKLMVE